MQSQKKIFLLLMLVFLCFCHNAFAIENLFYMLRDDSPDKINDAGTGFNSLKNNPNYIHIVGPQAYQVDRQGIVWGEVDSRIMTFAAQHQIKVMPLVTNVDFSHATIHAFLNDAAAQARTIQDLLTACQKNHYYGIQFDFEGISIDDKDALTRFYSAAADVLHKNGFAISVTVVPQLTTDPASSNFLGLRYENWSGAYDYKALAKSCDFLTLMAYDQHNDGTTPGPVAALPWVEDIIKYALQQIPAQKISLGIPVYSDFWYVGGSPKEVHVRMDQIGYADVQEILKKVNAKLNWDPNQQIPFSIFDNHWLYEYIYAENAESFKAKYNLAKKYHLRGVSVWRMGLEDPGIWKIVNERTGQSGKIF